MTAFELNDWPPFRQHALDLIEASLRTGKLVDGPNTAALENVWREDTGAAYCLSCSSGTAALYMALAAAGVEGREVVVPAFTFSGSIFPIIMAGAKPVYADIDPHTYCVTAETVTRVVTKKTAAILPVHIHGYPIDLQSIRAAIGDDIHIIEDACQAVGSDLPDGRRAGRFGLAGGFSLNQTKALPGGEGGLIITDDPDLAETMHTLRRFGERWDEVSPRTYIVEDRRGGNYRIDELCAAVTLGNLPHLAGYTEQARMNAATMISYLQDIPGIAPPANTAGHSWQKFRVRTGSQSARDKALAALDAAGIPVCLWQVAPMPDHTAFRDVDADVPVARQMLEDSFLFFTGKNPIHAQNEDVVSKIGEKAREVLLSI
ncbi:MAG: DegT/DnrJ/EryC1/StrS family aminotransferase [Thermomicrobiales bacterium]